MMTIAMMMKKILLEVRWQELIPDVNKPVFQLVDATHPLEFYIGRNPSGEFLLLLVTKEKPYPAKPMRTLKIDIFEREDGRWSFLIGLSDSELRHVFALLCEDLIEGARKIPDFAKPVSYVIGRLAMWQRLLERNTNGLLSDVEIRGLVGELVFLKCRMIPFAGIEAAIQGWVGPQLGDQDFKIPSLLCEVKSVRPDAISVSISSEMQLYSPVSKLVLALIYLEENNQNESDRDFSLNGLVRSLRRIVSQDFDTSELFESRLYQAGYLTRSEYNSPIFHVISVKEYEITEKFPRLTPPDLPIGVSSVSYNINISAFEKFLKSQIEDVRINYGT